MEKIFDQEFAGMTDSDFSYQDFETTREKLIKEIHAKLNKNQKDFIISLQEGSPRWDLLELDGISKLPAILWKLENIQKMDVLKKNESLEKLKRVLNA